MDTINQKDSTTSKQEQPKKVQAQPKKTGVLKKLDAETAKLLQSIKDKANKKSFGRTIRDSEIISIGLKQVTPEIIQELQERSLTTKDRLNIAHEEFAKKNGKISMDQFLEKLLHGVVQN